jgi:hypothetical protein
MDETVTNGMREIGRGNKRVDCPSIFPVDSAIRVSHHHEFNTGFLNRKETVNHIQRAGDIRPAYNGSGILNPLDEILRDIIPNVDVGPPIGIVMSDDGHVLQKTLVVQGVIRIVEAKGEDFHTYSIPIPNGGTLILSSGME